MSRGKSKRPSPPLPKKAAKARQGWLRFGGTTPSPAEMVHPPDWKRWEDYAQESAERQARYDRAQTSRQREASE
jgi:hypothetical protein